MQSTNPRPLKTNVAQDSASEQAKADLLEAELESIRRRMKFLEKRLDDLEGRPQNVEPLSVAAVAEKNTAPAPPTNVTPSVPSRKRSHRRYSRSSESSTNSASSSTTKSRRRSTKSKVTKSFFHIYAMLIGTLLLAILIAMVVNLFRPITYVPLGKGSSESSAATPDLIIDDRPNLNELRQSFQDSEE